MTQPNRPASRATKLERERARVDLGLCRYCPQPNLGVGAVPDRCFRHGVQRLLSWAGLTKGRLSAPDAKRRENLTAYLKTRFDAVVAGQELLNWDDALKEAFAVRENLNISWGGAKGVEQTAKVIQQVEKMAMKRRPHADV